MNKKTFIVVAGIVILGFILVAGFDLWSYHKAPTILLLIFMVVVIAAAIMATISLIRRNQFPL